MSNFPYVGVNVSSPTPETTSGIGGPCPAGYYCPEQTENPAPCPNTTYRPDILGEALYDCWPCKLGHYCATENMTDATGPCDPGFFCLRGNAEPNPTTVAPDIGGPCPKAHYCPSGTSYPLGCEAGTYNNQTGEASCTTCVEGYYCPENTTTYEVNLVYTTSILGIYFNFSFFVLHGY